MLRWVLGLSVFILSLVSVECFDGVVKVCCNVGVGVKLILLSGPIISFKR